MISVIVPTYNRASPLKKTVQSILSQTHQDFELIIVDDGSTDDTDKTIPKDSRITLIRQENKGPSHARNVGIKKSKGDTIAFLDSDDWWDKNKLEMQFRCMEKNPGYLISYTGEVWYKNGRLFNQKQKHKKFHGYIFDKCLPLCVVSMSTIMIRRELFEKIGLFDESLPCCEDYDFWLRASVEHEFLLIDLPLTSKDGGRPDQLSSIHATGMDKYRIQSIKKLLDRGLLDEKQQDLATKELRKKCRIYGNGCIKHGREEEGRYYLNLKGTGSHTKPLK